MKKRRVSGSKQQSPPPSPSYRLSLSGWFLGACVLLAPLIAGRLELGGEPVEPSLIGVISGLFSSGTLLPVAIWAIAVGVLGAAIVMWKRPPAADSVLPKAAYWISLLWLAWLAVSALWSVYPWGSWVAWSQWSVALVGGWFFARQRRTEAVALLHLVALAGTLAAAFALREYGENVRDVPSWRVFGTFFNPNFLAGYLCLTMPVTLALALAVPPSRYDWRWLLGMSACMQMVGILLTGSRFGVASAVLALGVLVVWMGWKRLWSRQRLLTISAVILVVAVSSSFTARALTTRVVTPQSAQTGEHSGGFRVWTWRGTLRMALAHPLAGTGLGTYELAYPRYAYVGFTRLAHNSYLQLAAEAGLPALLALVGLLGVLGWKVLRAERLSSGEDQPASENFHIGVLRAGLAGAVAAGLARNLIDSDWYIFACLFTFWANVGLLLALTGAEEGSASQPAWRARIPQAVILVGAFAILTLRMAGALSANSANWSLMQGNPDEKGFLRALRWEPWNGDHALSLGILYTAMARGGASDRARDAERWLLRAANQTPYPKTWYQLGNLYRDLLGDRQNAVAAYRRALQLDPHALRVMVELGKTLEQQGQAREAHSVYQQMIALETSVYNQVRAVPEIPEVDYAFAYAGLARTGKQLGAPGQQVRDWCKRALQILEADQEARQSNPMAQAMPRPPEREQELLALRQECEQVLR